MDATRTITRGDAKAPEATPPEGTGREYVAGDTIGPFVVIQELGRGGMGAVYLAEDPRLERRVAVKVHHAMTERAVARFEREARVLARLSHPHVVAVHEVGDCDGRLYIAMEYLDGGTARQWLEVPRATAQILSLMRSAGAGLAAAHAAGLVHQDFKLDNLLVARDGRVCVADFGVASLERSGRTEDEREGRARELASRGGTLGYAAPEQLRGGKIDATADQFAFCVSVYEALYGTRPFLGRSVQEILHRIESQELAPPRIKRRVPRSVQRAVLRGLRAVPEQRHRSMATLLERLRPSRAGRIVLGGAAVAVLAGFVGLRVIDEAPACAGGAAAIGKVWSEPQRAQLYETFEATGLGYAGPLRDRVVARLDHYTRQWADTYDDACVATRVEGVRSETMLDVQASCLQKRRRELAAVVDGLLEVKKADLVNAHRLLATLTPVSRCNDLDRLMRARIPGSSWSNDMLTQPLEAQLAAARAQRILGRHAEAAELASGVIARSRALGDSRLVARSVMRLAVVRQAQGDFDGAVALAHEAAAAAAASSDSTLRASIWARLVGWVGYDQRQPDAALALADVAEANLASQDDLEVRGLLETSLASVYLRKHEPERAEPHLIRALELQRQAFGDDHDNVAVTLNNLGVLYRRWGRLAEARTQLERAVQLRAETLGDKHPLLAGPHLNLANVHRDLGNLERALEHARASCSIRESVYPEGHPDLIVSLRTLGLTLSALHRNEEALDVHWRALAFARSLYEAPHEHIARSVVGVATVLADLGDYDGSTTQYRAALDMYGALGRSRSPEAARATADFSQTLLNSGRTDDAHKAAKRATALLHELFPPDDTERVSIELLLLPVWDAVLEPAQWRTIAKAWAERALQSEAPWLRAQADAIQQGLAVANPGSRARGSSGPPRAR